MNSVGKKLRTKTLRNDNTIFRYFSYVRYDTDNIIQQALRYSGSMQEGKLYFKGNHKLYGFKINIFGLPNGLATVFLEHYTGSAL